MKKSGKITKILKKIDRTPEYTLRAKLFEGYGYIDTPGNYNGEKKDYANIYEYYEQNMGKAEFDKLLQWIFAHPTQVNKFMKSK